MKCERSAKLVDSYLNKEISEKGKKQLGIHLKACPACNKEFERSVKTEKFLSSLKFSKEARNISALYRSSLKKQAPKKAFFSRIPVLAGIAASILFIFAGGYLVSFSPKKTDTVEKGINFLINSQNYDGSWDLNYFKNSISATSIAVLSIMENKNYEKTENYKYHVEKGIRFILDNAKSNGLIAGENEGSAAMYAHGYAMLALSKYSLKNNSNEVKDTLRRAVRLSEGAQNKNGGWRYQPVSQDDDVLVTSGQVLALTEARKAGVEVSMRTIIRGAEYVSSCVKQNGEVSYRPNDTAGESFARTNAGIVVAYKLKNYSLNWVSREMLEHFSEKDKFFFYGLSYYTYYFDQIKATKELQAQKTKVCRSLILKQKKNGSWSDTIGESYATAAAILFLEKNGVHREG